MSPADGDSPAARTLLGYLESLRADAPQPRGELVPEIVRRARWQRAFRAPIWAAGTFVAVLADGVAVLLGAQRGPRR